MNDDESKGEKAVAAGKPAAQKAARRAQAGAKGGGATKTELALSQINRDGGTQSRAELSEETIVEYQEALDCGAKFPPPIVFFDGKEYLLADGFHRVRAYERAGRKRIACDVRKGNKRDAILFSVGANTAHGLRRSNADKRRAIGLLLRDEQWRKKSDLWIGKACGVSDKTVTKIRGELEATSEIRSSDERLGQDGKVRKLPTQSAPVQTTTPALVPAPVPEKTIAPAELDGAMPAAQPLWKCERCGREHASSVKECPCAQEFADGDKAVSLVNEVEGTIDRAFFEWPTSQSPKQLRQLLELKVRRARELEQKQGAGNGASPKPAAAPEAHA
jgi:hypothetical protein